MNEKPDPTLDRAFAEAMRVIPMPVAPVAPERLIEETEHAEPTR